DVADLLGRLDVFMDQYELNKFLNGKTIIVTGAVCSIGSEVCRQIAMLPPTCLVLLGAGEKSISLRHRA
ncbi:polysaccharide biosynthesis protein, partial [Streptococcus suis]